MKLLDLLQRFFVPVVGFHGPAAPIRTSGRI
jgi:hypothetical protein